MTRLRAQLRELGFYDRVTAKLADATHGVIVDGVESGGAAGLAHLRRGDVIVRLGGRNIDTSSRPTISQATSSPIIALSVVTYCNFLRIFQRSSTRRANSPLARTSVASRGRGSGTSSTWCTRPGRGLSTTTRSER